MAADAGRPSCLLCIAFGPARLHSALSAENPVQVLTANECSAWLRQRAIIESPYANNRSKMSLQFEPPRSPRRLTAFTRQLFEAFGDFPGALVQFTDWNTHNPDEMALFDSLRRSHGEQRTIIEAPGHLFASTEAAEALGHCYLVATFDWSAYLYLASGAATVYFWEGDLVDLWSCDESIHQKVWEAVKTYELRVTFKIAA